MTATQPTTEQPFWKDEQNPYAPPLSHNAERIQRAMMIFTLIYRVIWVTLLVGICVLIALKLPIVWILVVFEAGVLYIVLRRYFSWLRRGRDQLPAAEIQRLARERTGADVIGSALHTAGHPLLTVNQPVVLALRGGELTIYNYSSSQPIDTVNVADIQDIRTVVFDDENVPHSNIVSNTAQALQLTFLFRGSPYTCSFRRMYKVRAIGWYQAIQSARALNRS